MALGQKIQAAKLKVNTKLGTQDGSIVFRKTAKTDSGTWGRPYTAHTDTDVSITAGIKVSRVRAFQTDSAGQIRVGDLRLMIPGGLVTEAQLTDAVVVYGGITYSVVTRRPVEILSGVATEWEVIAREQR